MGETLNSSSSIMTEEVELFLDCIGIVALAGYTAETRLTQYLNKITYNHDHHLGLAFLCQPEEFFVPVANVFSYKKQETENIGSYLVHNIERSSLWNAIQRNNIERIRYLVQFLDHYTINKSYYNYERVPQLELDAEIYYANRPMDLAELSYYLADGRTGTVRRTLREITGAYKHSWPIVKFEEYPPLNCHDIRISILGPPLSPYAGGIFHITIHYPPAYPFRCPTIHVHTTMYHPYISRKQWCYMGNDWWSPAITLHIMLCHLYALLDLDTLKISMEEDTDTMLNPEAAQLFLNNREEFIRKAARMTRLYAQPTMMERIELSSHFFPQGTPFLFAVYKGNKAIAKLLLDAGADIHALDYYGNNALIISITNLDVEMVKLLLDYKINVRTTVSARGESLYDLLTDTPIIDDITDQQEIEIMSRRKEILLMLEPHGLVIPVTGSTNIVSGPITG